ncbi:MAG: Na+/H+ antiporter subunit E [Desulfobacterales bacterium]
MDLNEKRRLISEIPDDTDRVESTVSKRHFAPYVLTFVVSFVTWLVLSGKFDLFHLTLGVVSCLIVSFSSGDLLLTTRKVSVLPGQWLRFIAYVPWLIFQVLAANFHVLKLTFHPRMHELINPRIIIFNSRLKSEMSRFVFANSITLTPGTVTVYVSIFGKFSVHAIDDASAAALPGEMEKRVAAIFGE